MDTKTRNRLAELYDFTRKTRYTSELKKLDKRLNFYWNKYVGKWTIFQNNKLIMICENEREGINNIKYIFDFHRKTPNSNKKVEQMFAENMKKQEEHKNKYIDEISDEAGDRAVVAMYGKTPMVMLGE